MKMAVKTVFVGKGRVYNRRFLQMCGHYLVEPTACTPSAGWEKGQVENQVGLVRERFRHATPQVQELRRAQRLAPRQVRLLCQGSSTPRGHGPDGLVRVRGRAPQARAARMH